MIYTNWDVLQKISQQGLFQYSINSVLIGTCAFILYANEYGFFTQSESIFDAKDIDIAQDTLNTGVSKANHKKFFEYFLPEIEFIEIPSLNHKYPSTSFKIMKQDVKIDFLCPMIGREQDKPVFIENLGIHAHPLRFLDYLIEDAKEIPLKKGSNVLVRVPTPEKFALHKLIISQRRTKISNVKPLKDLKQAEILISTLLPENLEIFHSEWQKLVSKGKKWRQLLHAGLQCLPENIQKKFSDEML